MKSHYYKDLKKRVFIKKKELLKISCIFIIHSKEISNLLKYKIYLNFFFSKKLNLNFEFKNHCILTKDIKAVNRFTSLTRTNLKNILDWGYLNGLRKRSW